MKLLVISNFYPPHFLGGYELQCRLHVSNLANRGHEALILTSRWKGGDKLVDDGVYRLLHLRNAVESNRSQDSTRMSLAIRRRVSQFKWLWTCRKNYDITAGLINDFNPDSAYIWNMEYVSLAPVLAAHNYSIPTVFRVSDYWLRRLQVEIGLEPNPLKRRFRAALAGLQNWSALQFDDMVMISGWVKQRYLEVGFGENTMTV
ncbi:MAG: hypothetical protein JW963_07580, partial [Anaerolineales bacterium]|nr:hypothetical protein [Anaerolineales bacterium]